MISGELNSVLELQELLLSDILPIMPFTKGHIGFNKGLKLAGEYRQCLGCGKESWIVKSRLLNGGGKFCSRECANKMNAKKGKESWNYKKKVGYYAVHDWLQVNFGKALKCEQCGSDKNVQWAKLKGKPYQRKRKNF